MDTEYYWQLVERDGTVTYVAPRSVSAIENLWKNNQPINLKTKIIPAHQIVKFAISSRPYGEQLLLEAASQAFRDPIYVDVDMGHGRTNQSVKGRWVKKAVTADRWSRYYAESPGYRYLAEENDMVVVAFILAVHDIDQQKTPYCTDSEVEKLTHS